MENSLGSLGCLFLAQDFLATIEWVEQTCAVWTNDHRSIVYEGRHG